MLCICEEKNFYECPLPNERHNHGDEGKVG